MRKIELTLPKLHPAQQQVKDTARRFNVLVCGRRWGKTTLTAEDLVVDVAVIKGLPVAYCEPSYPMMVDVFERMLVKMAPVIQRYSRALWKIWLLNGAVIDFWSLSNPDTIRGHPYGLVIFDEAGFCANLQEVWDNVFRPTLFDYKGDAWFVGTPKGWNFFRTLFIRGQAGKDGESQYADWISWQMPTSANPHIPQSEIDAARLEMPEDAYLQEVEAQFLEDGAGVFKHIDRVVDTTITADEDPQQGRIYSLGVDWARYSDFTVLTVLRDDGRQVYWDRYNNMPWEQQVERAARIAVYYSALTYCDQTGVGDPLLDQLRNRIYELQNSAKSGAEAIGYQFTNKSKRELIDACSLDIEREILKMRNIPTQINEFKSYAYETTASGNIIMNAPSGQHDDCVCSFALANWGRRRQGEVRIPTPDMTPIVWGQRVPIDETPMPDKYIESPDEYVL